METFICEAQLWNQSYKLRMKKETTDCSCVLAAPPPLRPVYATISTRKRNQTYLSIDVVYINNASFLHVIDALTKWSELGVLQTR